MRLHHTYGVPLIPGSALKGLAAHYCHEVLVRPTSSTRQAAEGLSQPALRHDRRQRRHPLRGWLDASRQPGPGDQGLLADVMTPHHQKWQTDENVAPTDFDSPIPVPFLSVAGCFHVAVCWQGPEHAQAEAWTKRAMEMLRARWRNGASAARLAAATGACWPKNLKRRPDLHLLRNFLQPKGLNRPKHPYDKRVAKSKSRSWSNMRKSKAAFSCKSRGRRKRGLLTGGKPPSDDKLPEIGAEIDVYINSLGPPPQYRWDAPPPPPTPSRGGRAGAGPRPGGRR